MNAPNRAASAASLVEASITINYPDLSINIPQEGPICLNGMPVHFTPSESRIFIALAKKVGIPVSLEELQQGDPNLMDTTLKVHIRHIRVVLNSFTANAERYLCNRYRHGYYLVLPEEGVAVGVEIVKPDIVFTMTVGPMTLTLDNFGSVKMNGVEVALTYKESDLFALLASTPGVAWTKLRLLKHLYSSEEEEPEQKIIDVFVCKIRRKLRDTATLLGFNDVEKVVTLLWGIGYYLDTSQVVSPPKVPMVLPAELLRQGARTLTREQLPYFDGRWVVTRKALILKMIDEGVVTEDEVLQHYPMLTRDNLQDWRAILNQDGLAALRVTKLHW